MSSAYRELEQVSHQRRLRSGTAPRDWRTPRSRDAAPCHMAWRRWYPGSGCSLGTMNYMDYYSSAHRKREGGRRSRSARCSAGGAGSRVHAKVVAVQDRTAMPRPLSPAVNRGQGTVQLFCMHRQRMGGREGLGRGRLVS